jgi:hypothetical protein
MSAALVSAATAAQNTGICSLSWVSRMAARLRFQPIERSMPPVRITNVCPPAMIPR